ncbi:MAG: hypothetical protein KGI98_12030 [Euryarchaeota archaeon]|nr:hypothetical protein [Euryarchaeota archaeon]MDE1881198.1 hypothetical protein [Euryarchaeota archaeon]
MPGSPESPYRYARTRRWVPLTPVSDTEFHSSVRSGHYIPVGFHKRGGTHYQLRCVKIRPQKAIDNGQATVFTPEAFLSLTRDYGLVVMRDPAFIDSIRLVRDPRLTDYMRRNGGVRAAASVAVLSVLILLVISGFASASGLYPVPPNPSNPQAIKAVAKMSSGSSAYVEAFHFSQTFSPQWKSPAYTLTTGFDNASGPAFGSTAATGYSYAFWINYSRTCGSGCPPYTLYCNGVAMSNPVYGAAACSILKVDYGSSKVVGIPTLNVTRIWSFYITESASWTSSSSGASLTSSVTVFSQGPWVSPWRNYTEWSVRSMSWAIPLPSGSYDTARTTAEFLNTTTFLTSTQFLVTSNYILLQWVLPPVASCVTCDPPTGSNEGWNYQFELVNTGQVTGGGSGLLVPPATNVTVPPGLPATQTPGLSVVLSFVSPQQTSPNNYSGSVAWTNPFDYAFSGPWQITSSWWCFQLVTRYIVPNTGITCNVTAISVQANGIPLPATDYSVTQGSLYIYPGAATVPNGSTVGFSFQFHYVSAVNPLGSLVVLNGISWNVGDFVFIGGLLVSGVIGSKELLNRELRKSPRFSLALGLAMLSALVVGVLYL